MNQSDKCFDKIYEKNTLSPDEYSQIKTINLLMYKYT